ncbi:FAD-dependent oxidoreductase [Roseomonas sp. NAR14]|uniref:FAD-dependent oxidoreductase n=1 Tax=Roseomonas acroporae TaxID=2937791 RepID=A0A9X2BSC9_9PROT|nr:FAD-dependent oxidoreductase [Roseomonas acroporae]MCK8782997.1 FAD-dependent oxidoreductase [Roseomonas acroporae]
MHVLVIGAGPSGTRCAERIAGHGGARVTLVGAEPALPYDRVSLSKLLLGAAPGALVTHDMPALERLGIRYLSGTAIASIDRAARAAFTAAGERLAYDRLVLATGSQAVRLPLPGAHLHGVVPYRDLADIGVMRRACRLGGPAVVIGGGLLGLEVAVALAGLGMEVTVLHAVGWPMERQLDREAGLLLTRYLESRGVRFVMPAKTAAVLGDGAAEAVLLGDGTKLPARLVVMSVGVRPEVSLARAAGLPVNRGILVDDAMRTEDPAVYAVGECAEHRGAVCGLVAPAFAQAEAAAAAIRGEAAAYVPRTDAAALKVSGVSVWSAGEIAATDAESIVRRDEGLGHYRRLLLRDGRLVGAVLYGDTADAGLYFDLIISGRPVSAFRGALALGGAFLPGNGMADDLKDAA